MAGPASSPAAPPAPPVAATLFGPRLDAAARYADLLAGAGIERGLIGPREVERLWDRHVLNCAALGELLPQGVRVVDVGSGAGLPGIPLALARPDLTVDLVEPLERRSVFLQEVCAELSLEAQVRVVRGRAEDVAVRSVVGNSDWVTARAVAPLARLVRWCLPLLRPGGHLLAMKGASVREEIERDGAEIRASGGEVVDVRSIGATLAEQTSVAMIRRRGKR